MLRLYRGQLKVAGFLVPLRVVAGQGNRGSLHCAQAAIDHCKTNVRVSLFRANFKKCFVSVDHLLRRPTGDETGVLRFMFVLLNLDFCFLLGHDFKSGAKNAL